MRSNMAVDADVLSAGVPQPTVRRSLLRYRYQEKLVNYGEDYAYWYLRLNGFFPISNFVVHRSAHVAHDADVDVVAVRPAHVYEEVGGQGDDWDPYLREHLPFDRMLGVVCEVKTGAFDKGELFREGYLRYTLPRLGVVPEAGRENVIGELLAGASVALPDGSYVAKLLISQEPSEGPYLNRTLADIRTFIATRIEKYSLQKYAARMFFPSNLLQDAIDRVGRAAKKDAV